MQIEINETTEAEDIDNWMLEVLKWAQAKEQEEQVVEVSVRPGYVYVYLNDSDAVNFRFCPGSVRNVNGYCNVEGAEVCVQVGKA